MDKLSCTFGGLLLGMFLMAFTLIFIDRSSIKGYEQTGYYVKVNNIIYKLIPADSLKTERK